MRSKEKFVAVVFIIIGLILSFLFWRWISNQTHQVIFPIIQAVGPVIVVVGFGLLLFPSPVLERQSRGENLSDYPGRKMLTKRWWCIIVLAAIIEIVLLVLANVSVVP